MKQYKAFLMLVTLALMVLVGSGCSKLTKQNYDKLKVGMGFKEVVGILGDDAMCVSVTAGTKICYWNDEPKNITVKFVEDKVIFMGNKGI
jgi:hypothetical protein